MSSKKELRKFYIQKRSELSLAQRHAAIAAMLEQFAQINLPSNALVMSYRSMEERGEVSAAYFEEYCMEAGIAAGFCFPAANFENSSMQAYLADESLVWEDAPFGLTQPFSGTPVAAESIDVVFVPLLAFDVKGNRLGYGKGFYDRYLLQCRPDAVKIGFSWFGPEESLPQIGEHDLPLNYCVTPHRNYVF